MKLGSSSSSVRRPTAMHLSLKGFLRTPEAHHEACQSMISAVPQTAENNLSGSPGEIHHPCPNLGLSCHTGIQTAVNGVATNAIPEETKIVDNKECSVTELCCSMTMLGPVPLVTLKHWFDNFVGSSSITHPTARIFHPRHGQRFETNDEVKTAVESWLHSLAENFYKEVKQHGPVRHVGPVIVTTVVPVSSQPTHMICPHCYSEITTTTKTEPGIIAYISGIIIAAIGVATQPGNQE
ncbi:hypothetical protein J6590_037399 [Homalodisca vitripennis]|nr:hypothetical protein J6590_037399 [Homalodisca vitripennis]